MDKSSWNFTEEYGNARQRFKTGGEPGERGGNRLLHEGVETVLPGKAHFQAQPGDRLTIASPGGGGRGKEE